MLVDADRATRPARCAVSIDDLPLAAGVAIVLAPTMLRVLTADVASTFIRLLAKAEGISWCRGWDGDAARALMAAVLLR